MSKSEINILYDRKNTKMHFADIFVDNKLILRIRFCVETKVQTEIYHHWNGLNKIMLDDILKEVKF
jgi:hypothetical protein